MVTIHCPLCDHNNNKRFISLGNRLFPVNISICRECGFVFQNPRFSEEQWENYYNTDYDTYHRPVLLSGKAATEPDHAAREIDRRLQKLHITAAQSMLDIGAGRGDILNYFMTNNPGTLKLFAIEPSHASQPGLEARGIKVIGSSINQFVDGPPGAMNLIVLRHVIEHLYDPLASLRIITGFMNEDSFLYIAVPNLFSPEGGVFQFPHISYFNKYTIEALTQKSNLWPMVIEEVNDELYGIFKYGKSRAAGDKLYEFNYEITMEYLNNHYNNMIIKQIKRQITNFIPKSLLANLLKFIRHH